MTKTSKSRQRRTRRRRETTQFRVRLQQPKLVHASSADRQLQRSAKFVHISICSKRRPHRTRHGQVVAFQKPFWVVRIHADDQHWRQCSRWQIAPDSADLMRAWSCPSLVIQATHTKPYRGVILIQGSVQGFGNVPDKRCLVNCRLLPVVGSPDVSVLQQSKLNAKHRNGIQLLQQWVDSLISQKVYNKV